MKTTGKTKREKAPQRHRLFGFLVRVLVIFLALDGLGFLFSTNARRVPRRQEVTHWNAQPVSDNGRRPDGPRIECCREFPSGFQ
jgi:hypothetical protein